jgi:hypothetical protein
LNHFCIDRFAGRFTFWAIGLFTAVGVRTFQVIGNRRRLQGRRAYVLAFLGMAVVLTFHFTARMVGIIPALSALCLVCCLYWLLR